MFGFTPSSSTVSASSASHLVEASDAAIQRNNAYKQLILQLKAALKQIYQMNPGLSWVNIGTRFASAAQEYALLCKNNVKSLDWIVNEFLKKPIAITDQNRDFAETCAKAFYRTHSSASIFIKDSIVYLPIDFYNNFSFALLLLAEGAVAARTHIYLLYDKINTFTEADRKIALLVANTFADENIILELVQSYQLNAQVIDLTTTLISNMDVSNKSSMNEWIKIVEDTGIFTHTPAQEKTLRHIKKAIILQYYSTIDVINTDEILYLFSQHALEHLNSLFKIVKSKPGFNASLLKVADKIDSSHTFYEHRYSLSTVSKLNFFMVCGKMEKEFKFTAAHLDCFLKLTQDYLQQSRSIEDYVKRFQTIENNPILNMTSSQSIFERMKGDALLSGKERLAKIAQAISSQLTATIPCKPKTQLEKMANGTSHALHTGILKPSPSNKREEKEEGENIPLSHTPPDSNSHTLNIL